MAKIDNNDTEIFLGELLQLRRAGWISSETGEDAVIAVAQFVDSVTPDSTGEIEMIEPETDRRVMLDIEVDADGVVRMALRARCECGNPWGLCHPDA